MTGGVSAAARELAARLSVLFERDVEIVQRLNDAQRRLLGANLDSRCGNSAEFQRAGKL